MDDPGFTGDPGAKARQLRGLVIRGEIPQEEEGNFEKHLKVDLSDHLVPLSFSLTRCAVGREIPFRTCGVPGFP